MRYVMDPDLSVGRGDLDDQHLEIIRLLAEVQDRVDAGDSQGAGQALDALGNAVISHFVTEEALMEQWQYPERTVHKGAHDLFIRDLLALVQEHADSGLSEEVVEWAQGRMPEWLTFHILTNDAPLGRYLASRQRRPGAATSPGAPAKPVKPVDS